MSTESKIERRNFPPGTILRLGPSLDSDLFIPTQPVEGALGKVTGGWQTVEVTLKTGEKPLILYQAFRESKRPGSQSI